MTGWTKEQLKLLAGVSSTGKKEIVDDLLTEDVSKLKRKFNKRAIPKVAFSAILLAPDVGFTYMFAANNLNLNDQEVEAAELDPQTQQLLEKLEASNERIEELEIQLAVMKPKKPPVTEVKELEETPPLVPKIENRSKPITKSPPPKQIVRRRVVTPQRTPPPKRTVAPPPQQLTIPVAVAPSVFGVASSQDVQGEATPVSYSSTLLTQRGNNFKQVAHNFPTVNPELEASLLQEQPMVVLKIGASTKANLAVPWVQDLGSRRAESETISVVLTEPLRGAGRRLYLPAKTIIFVKPDYLGQPDILEFVGIEAQLPTSTDGSARKITLPEGVIRFAAEDGKPLVALPVRNKARKSGGRDFFDILDSAEGVWRISNQVSWGDSDDVVGEVLRGQRKIRSRLEQRNRYPSYQSRSQQVVYLPEGTKLKLYVNQEVTVPSISN